MYPEDQPHRRSGLGADIRLGIIFVVLLLITYHIGMHFGREDAAKSYSQMASELQQSKAKQQQLQQLADSRQVQLNKIKQSVTAALNQ